MSRETRGGIAFAGSAFLLAVFLYSEPFTAAHGVAFALIWSALGLYTADFWFRLRRLESPALELGSPRAPLR